MYNICNFIFFDNLFIGLFVANVEQFELAREVNITIANIAGDDLVVAKLLAKGFDHWHANLAFAADYHDPVFLPWSVDCWCVSSALR